MFLFFVTMELQAKLVKIARYIAPPNCFSTKDEQMLISSHMKSLALNKMILGKLHARKLQEDGCQLTFKLQYKIFRARYNSEKASCHESRYTRYCCIATVTEWRQKELSVLSLFYRKLYNAICYFIGTSDKVTLIFSSIKKFKLLKTTTITYCSFVSGLLFRNSGLHSRDQRFMGQVNYWNFLEKDFSIMKCQMPYKL